MNVLSALIDIFNNQLFFCCPGSEFGSDEDLDLDERDDILEAEAGDAEEINEDELRDQVGRVHL